MAEGVAPWSGRRLTLRRHHAGSSSFRWMVAGIAMATAILPLLWVLRIALKPQESYLDDPSGVGGGFTLDNFVHAWSTGEIGRGIANSVAIVPVGAVAATALAALGGFALAKLDLPLRRLWFTVIAMSIAVPLPAIIIPLFDEGLALGLVNNRAGLILLYAAIFASWGTLFMYSYFQSIPDTLIDSARMDGASTVQIFVRVALPLGLPAVATVLIINFFIQWSELLLALVMLSDPTKQTAIVKVALFSTQYRSGGPLTAAIALVSAAPVLLVFLLGQRFIRAGAFVGATKG